MSLWDNKLSGPIPPELGRLTNLEMMNLSENDLSGPIPPELGSLDSLWLLYVRGNDFSGCIPEGLHRVRTGDLDRLDLPFCN